MRRLGISWFWDSFFTILPEKNTNFEIYRMNNLFNTTVFKPKEWISTPKSMKNPENLHRTLQILELLRIKEYLFKICWKINEPVQNGSLSTTENCPGTDDFTVNRFYYTDFDQKRQILIFFVQRKQAKLTFSISVQENLQDIIWEKLFFSYFLFQKLPKKLKTLANNAVVVF
jgi:hypothetical protein